MSVRFFLALVLSFAAGAQTPVISTVAGTGVRGFAGDGGPAAVASLALANLQNDCDPLHFEQSSHISIDLRGNLYIADSANQRIRRISSIGVIGTVAGAGDRPSTNAQCQPTSSIGDGGSVLDAKFFNPSDAIFLPNGNLVIADQQDNRIRQVTPDGVIRTIAGNGMHNLYAPGVPATSSPMDWPSSLAMDAQGLIYFAELHGNRVAKIGADGRLTTIAGNGFPGFNGDNIPGTSAQLKKPAGIAIDSQRNVYIADTGNHRVRKVAADGTIATIAGTGQQGDSGDGGPAAKAMLNTPMDVKVDSAGAVYIADTGNHRVRRVDASGVITTVAGTGNPGRGADLVDATTSELDFPSALAVDSQNDLYIVDWQNYLIRKVSFGGRPVLTPGGVVNSASFTSTPVAPGSIVAIFGANLAPAPEVASGFTWPNQLMGTTVEINGSAIPLYFVSPGQISAQLPFDLAPGTAKAVVKSGPTMTNEITFNVAPAAPGIFELGSRRAAALNQDVLTVNSPDHPESRGNVIVMFLTGIGPVSPAVASGQPAPIDVFCRSTLSASATIGNADATIEFLGLTPGAIGLAQANLRIPMTISAGSDVPVAIRIGDQTSNVAQIAVR